MKGSRSMQIKKEDYSRLTIELANYSREKSRLEAQVESNRKEIEGKDKRIKYYIEVVDDLHWDIKRLTQHRDALLYSMQLMHGKSVDMQTIVRKTKVEQVSNSIGVGKLVEEVKLAV